MTSGSQASRAIVAAFDVDGTLTRRDTFLPFLARTAGAPLVLALGRHVVTTARAVAGRDRDALKALACAALAGVPEAEARARGAAHARRIEADQLRKDTRARLRHHQQLGHRAVLVSASLDLYVEPLGELLGVDGVVCTRLAVDGGGLLSGALDGPNCRGAEKVVRLREWLAQNQLDDAELWAYGDSKGDDPLLAIAEHPVRVKGVTVDADPYADVDPAR